jgi:isoquinoline 1-oxidoreductase alpha subunit
MIKFTLNGKQVSTEAEADTPLLWVIRDEFKLKGTKFGCGIAQCGACTVHVDGVPLRSCSAPVSGIEGTNITTIEGLDAEGKHPLQLAWIEAQVPQCGYCQSGQIMQAAELLQRKPSPTDDEITEHMNGNLCRCMSYSRIRKAVHLAADKLQSGGQS